MRLQCTENFDCAHYTVVWQVEFNAEQNLSTLDVVFACFLNIT